MKRYHTHDDRYPLLNHPYLHYGVSTTTTAFAAGVDSGNSVILANANITVTLPLAADNKGTAFFIKKITAAFGNVTIARTGADTIEGAGANIAIATAQNGVLLVSDGVSGWWILADKTAASPF